MKKNYYILFLGVLFLLLLCSVGGYVYMYTRISKKTSSIESTAIEIENEKKSQQNILGLKRSIELTQEKSRLLDSHFVAESTVVDFIKSIESLAKDRGVVVKISSLQPGEQIGKQGLFVTLTIDGNFSAVNNFLILLENMPYQIIVNRIQMSSQKNTLSSPTDSKTNTTLKTNATSWSASVDFVLTSYYKN